MEQPNGQRVTNIELFFDLVFVFTITQVTELVARAAGPPDLLRAALALMTIWWMYGGYAWLTNNVDADRPRVRLLLLAAMGGFLAMALAVPRLFAGDGWAFGAGYLLINALHAALFAHAPNPDSAQAIWRVAPINLGTALAVLVSAWLPPAWRDGLWGAALLVLLVLPWTRKPTGFALAPAHFVERHGLVILIALGESVVAIGLGSAGAALTLPLLGRAADPRAARQSLVGLLRSGAGPDRGGAGAAGAPRPGQRGALRLRLRPPGDGRRDRGAGRRHETLPDRRARRSRGAGAGERRRAVFRRRRPVPARAGARRRRR
ncbi:MAG TPA: low temperature requirement protein A, partial [Herpetosiphonaceae bacterium]